MSRQTIGLKSEYRVNSYCAIHSDQDVEVQINQREGGLVDCITQPCPQCLAESEAFGRANQKIDIKREKKMLYCIEVQRECEELCVLHHDFAVEPTRDDVLEVVCSEDIGYNDKYGKIEYYVVG